MKWLVLPVLLLTISPSWANPGDVEYSAWIDCVQQRARQGSTPDGAMHGCENREEDYVSALKGAYSAQQAELTYQNAKLMIRAVAENPRHS